ncbi:akirin-1 isoform X1 [Mirounga leonina]|uniref:akirin-1 isoform X1 n=1 Tax=Mirounga leonina TaxID=9715 RepID=UPI00156C378C|nr:akirin-1 isoform X1 [Mirounga leonina]XP_045726691.1 akirin-1 isoform X1 [Mirounga angustirostris]
MGEIREGWGGPSVRFRFSWSWRDWRGGQQEEDETIPGRSGPFPCAKPLLPPLPGPAQSRPADPVGHGKWDSTHEPGLEEQIFQNIKQEYSRYQRWRHLEVVLNQSEACTSESQPHSSALTAPSSPGSSWMKKDQPTFTLRQVGIICERLLKDYEDKIREEYEQILNTKLAEQYESFVKFTHDQIMRRYGTRPTSYVS